MKCKLNLYSNRCNLYYERFILTEMVRTVSFCGFMSICDFPFY
jgi:hypothetical protein